MKLWKSFAYCKVALVRLCVCTSQRRPRLLIVIACVRERRHFCSLSWKSCVLFEMCHRFECTLRRCQIGCWRCAFPIDSSRLFVLLLLLISFFFFYLSLSIAVFAQSRKATQRAVHTQKEKNTARVIQIQLLVLCVGPETTAPTQN